MSEHPATVIPAHTLEDIAEVNATELNPVVFIHGLWLLPSSWDRWADVFKAAGYAPITPGWPDGPETVAEANAHPEVFANGQRAGGARAVRDLLRTGSGRPAVPGRGHSLTIDNGWLEVAQTSLAFVERCTER